MAPAALAPFVPYLVGLMAAGTAYGAYTANQTAKFNEKMARQEADYQKAKGKVEGEQHLDRMRKQLAEQRVAFAKSGVSLMSSSVQDVFDEDLEEGLFDAIMIRQGSDVAARASLIKASSYRAEGRAALVQGALGVGSTLLTSAQKTP
jgi:hypothetical protein